MALRYAPGPEYGALTVVGPNGAVMGSVGADGVTYTLPDRDDLDGILAKFKFPDGSTFSTTPKRAGYGAAPSTMASITADHKRIARMSLPAGSIQAIRAFVDANNPTSNANAHIKAIIHRL